MKERGQFFIFEGVGGSGKTSQLELAGNFLTENEIPNYITREPGGLPGPEHIREVIFNLKGENVINADHQLGFFFAARAVWVNELIRPKIDSGVNVLSDRSYPASAAYQGYAEGGNLETIEKISKSVMGEYMPNGVILLDVSVETAMERNSKNKDGDPFDDQDKDYFSRIINGYREMAENNWSDVDWYVVDAERPISEVHENVKDILLDVFKID